MIYKITPLALSEDTKAFDQLIDQKETIRIIPEYNRAVLKLNSYLYHNDRIRLEELFVQIEKAHFTERQKLDFYIRELMYYMDQLDKTKAQKVYKKIKTNKNFSKVRGQIELPYKVLVLNETDKLDQLIEKSKSEADPQKRVAYYMLISHIYETLKDKQQAKNYQDKAKEILKNNK
ncbi:hypothetical protein FC52_GL001536 [Lactobacillus pasteurii DSM 23907 = CRBIP 24.76]|nr:hypothetical protein FC52_GL001536 [Lactobacillus pasteurii DSM 23907 = CRBIP 24.76]